MANLDEITDVLWFDPGETTGYAMYDIRRDEFRAGQLTLTGVGEMLTSLVHDQAVELAVGYERFIVTDQGSKYASPEYPLKVCGIIDWLVYHHRYTMLKAMPSSSRNLGRDGGKLHKLGWWTPGKVHANDAAAHLVAWLLKTRKMPQHRIAQLFTS